MIIPPTWNLPESIRARLGNTTYGRQRTIFEDGHLLVVLHKPPGADDARREGALFWREPNGEWKASRGGSGMHALTAHVQSYADLEAQIQKQFDAAVRTVDLHELLASLTPLALAGHNMHAALQDAREAVKGEKFLIETRDRAYEVDRNMDLLLTDVRNELQFRTAREAEEQNRLSREALRASHRLNVLAALFLPLTGIASLFGMNLLHGLDQQSVPLFWTIAAVAVILGFFFKSWVLGKEEAAPAPENAKNRGAVGKR